MEKFTSLESLYDYLEKNAINHLRSYEIGTFFRELRDTLYKEHEKDEGAIQKAQWEIDFFHFKREEGRIAHCFTLPDEHGHIVEYPNLGRFDQDT